MLVATIFMASLLLGASVTISNFETSYFQATPIDEQYRYVGSELSKFENQINSNAYNRNQTLRMIEMSDYVYSDPSFVGSCLSVEISKESQTHRYDC